MGGPFCVAALFGMFGYEFGRFGVVITWGILVGTMTSAFAVSRLARRSTIKENCALGDMREVVKIGIGVYYNITRWVGVLYYGLSIFNGLFGWVFAYGRTSFAI